MPGNVDLFHSFFAGRGQFMVEGYDWTGHLGHRYPEHACRGGTRRDDRVAAAGVSGPDGSGLQGRQLQDLHQRELRRPTSITISIAGWAERAVLHGTVMAPREFVFGIFIYQLDQRRRRRRRPRSTAAKGELLREQIRDGMASCFHADLSLTQLRRTDPGDIGSEPRRVRSPPATRDRWRPRR